MGLAAFLIPPSLDAKQALRLRRFGLAALSYPLAAALVAAAWLFGLLAAPVALLTVALMIALNLGIYAAIRTGWNLRFPDPSLTRFQIIAAITLQMFLVYHMDDARNIALFGCFIVLAFGFFRFNARGFRLVTLYTLAAYALVINLMMHLRPQAIRDVHLEWMSWLMLAGFLPFFTTIGVQINMLRRRLHDSEERFRSLTEMSSDFYWESDAAHRLTDRASGGRSISTVTVFEAGTHVGRRRWEIPHLSPDEAGWRAHRKDLDAHRPFRQFELSRRGTDGTQRHISISGDPVFDERGKFTGYRGVGTDITERKLAEERIQRLAHHDSLTGLPNRLLFNDRLQQAIGFARRDQRQCALLYLDLSKFKAVNDTLGHAAGDTLLQEVAGRVRQQVRGSDTVARIGGDEFAVILPNVAGCGEAQIVAGKIVAALAVPFHVGDPARRADIGTSIGIACYPVDAMDADSLVKAADAAMYAAKQAGANVRG